MEDVGAPRENERVKIPRRRRSVFFLRQIRAPASQTNDRRTGNPSSVGLPLRRARRFSKLYLFNLNCRYRFKRDGTFQYRGAIGVRDCERMIPARNFLLVLGGGCAPPPLRDILTEEGASRILNVEWILLSRIRLGVHPIYKNK